MSHHVLFGDPGLRAAFTQNGGTGGAFPDDDAVVFGSVELNGVDTELVTLNALPAGECHVAIWLKWDTAQTTFRLIWETSDGLGANKRIGGGKAADTLGVAWQGVLVSTGGSYDGYQHLPPYAWELWIWTRAPSTDKWTLDTPGNRYEFPVAAANPVGLDRLTVGYAEGTSSGPFHTLGKIARMWVNSGSGTFVTAAQAALWRADSSIPVNAQHEWRPGAPGDSTSLIQDQVGDWDLTGSGGIVLGSDKP
jgi:hypothetical protein